MTASSSSTIMTLTGTPPVAHEVTSTDSLESFSLGLYDRLLASEVEAIRHKDYLWAWNPEKVEEVLKLMDVNPDSIETLPEDIAFLHSAYLRVMDDSIGDEPDPDFYAAGSYFSLRMTDSGEYGQIVLDGYGQVLAFMREQAEIGTNKVFGSSKNDILTSVGMIHAGERGIDTGTAIEIKDVLKRMGLIMEMASHGLTRNAPSNSSNVEAGGLPPSVTIAMIIATVALITTLLANNSEGVSKWLAGIGSGKAPHSEKANPEDLPQIPGVQGGDGPDPLNPSIGGDGGSNGSNPPIPAIVLTPTQDVMTIEKLALIPGAEREQMMFEATGVDFMTSDEAPHLGFEVVQGEDGTYSIGRVYNLLTGEMVEVPERANNVTPDTFTYVDQDWQSLDQEALGHVQVFPRVDGKGVVVLKMPVQYAVFSDDPSTTEVREFLTTIAPKTATNIELPTFASFDDAMEYVIFVKGARYPSSEAQEHSKDPDKYRAGWRYFYGGTVLTGGDLSTPDGKITFSMGIRLLPNGYIAGSFTDIRGIITQFIISMPDGIDANGHTVTEISDFVRVATGYIENSDIQNPLPLIPDDFLLSGN